MEFIIPEIFCNANIRPGSHALMFYWQTSHSGRAVLDCSKIGVAVSNLVGRISTLSWVTSSYVCGGLALGRFWVQ